MSGEPSCLYRQKQFQGWQRTNLRSVQYEGPQLLLRSTSRNKRELKKKAALLEKAAVKGLALDSVNKPLQQRSGSELPRETPCT